MKKLALSIFALFIVALLSCSQEADTARRGAPLPYQKITYNPSDKPTAPIDVDIRFENAPLAGQKTKIIFSAQSQTFAEDVELKIDTPPDIHIHSDCCKWRGKMAKASPQSIALECTIPDNKWREFIATATITYGNAKLVKVCSLIIGTEDDPSKPKPPAGTIKKNEKGEDIIEFKN